MHKNIIPIIIVAMVITMASCSKTEVTSNDYPILTFVTPAQNQTITGQSIHIVGTAQASATDDAHLLHEVALTIKTLPDSSVIFMHVYYIHALKTFDIDTTVNLSVSSGTGLILLGQVTNHMENITAKQVAFKVN
jgi:hypothetical protein